MAATALVVVNQALTLLGERKIASLADTDDISVTCNDLYEPMVVSILGKHKWRFCRTRIKLTIDTTPLLKWAQSFVLPVLNSNRIGAPHAFFASDAVGAQSTNLYELVGAKVETDFLELWILYTKRVAETLWPDSFTRFVAHAFAAEIAEPITQKTSIADKLKALAFGLPSDQLRGGMFLEALQEDTWSDPMVSIMEYSDPIAEARFGRG